jgi:hypothetical protein
MIRTIAFTILVFISFILNAQETRLMNLCHIGVDRIDVYLKYAENDYYLYAYIVKGEGFYIDKGSDLTIITVSNDTVHLVGLYEGIVEIKDHARNLMYPAGWCFTNKYCLNPDQIGILKSSEVKTISVDLTEGKLKMDVTDLRHYVLMESFEKLDKKMK